MRQDRSAERRENVRRRSPAGGVDNVETPAPASEPRSERYAAARKSGRGRSPALRRRPPASAGRRRAAGGSPFAAAIRVPRGAKDARQQRGGSDAGAHAGASQIDDQPPRRPLGARSR